MISGGNVSYNFKLLELLKFVYSIGSHNPRILIMMNKCVTANHASWCWALMSILACFTVMPHGCTLPGSLPLSMDLILIRTVEQHKTVITFQSWLASLHCSQPSCCCLFLLLHVPMQFTCPNPLCPKNTKAFVSVQSFLQHLQYHSACASSIAHMNSKPFHGITTSLATDVSSTGQGFSSGWVAAPPHLWQSGLGFHSREVLLVPSLSHQ
jgi:hypothetical protein